MRLFWNLLASPYPSNNHSYAEELLRRILQSERLTSQLLDKIFPTLTPEQVTNVLALSGGQGVFEQRLAQLRLEREAAAHGQAIDGEGRVIREEGEGE